MKRRSSKHEAMAIREVWWSATPLVRAGVCAWLVLAWAGVETARGDGPFAAACELQTLTASDAMPSDEFGTNIARYGDHLALFYRKNRGKSLGRCLSPMTLRPALSWDVGIRSRKR